MTTIALDMDQVFVDWNWPVAQLLAEHHNADPHDIVKRLDSGERVKNIGVDMAWLFGAIDAGGSSWWQGLPELNERFPNCPKFKELYLYCRGITPRVNVLTKASTSSACAGKVRWLRSRIPDFSAYIIVGSAELKQGFAKPGAVLLDDSIVNCEQFIANGGRAYNMIPSEFSLASFRDFVNGD
jgi:hypothetical protein